MENAAEEPRSMRRPSLDPHEGDKEMRKEFESGLAKNIAGKKAEKRVLGKAWMALVLGAVLLAGSAVTVAAMQNQGETGLGDQTQDQLKDGSCEDALTASDGVCDCPCDGVCDCTCDNCNCPCCADA